jgi:hypothetical protein
MVSEIIFFMKFFLGGANFFYIIPVGFLIFGKFQSLFAARGTRGHDRGQNWAKIAPVGKISGLRLCVVD